MPESEQDAVVVADGADAEASSLGATATSGTSSGEPIADPSLRDSDDDGAEERDALEAVAADESAALEREHERRGALPVPPPIGVEEGDPVLAASIAIARDALGEVTAPDDIGQFAGIVDEGDGVYSVQFATTVVGYPGWLWTCSMVHLAGDEGPRVLETELLPGDSALLAPAWVPWAERLAEYEASHTDEHPAHTPTTIEMTSRRRARKRTRVAASTETIDGAQPDLAVASPSADEGAELAEEPLDGALQSDDEATASESPRVARTRRSGAIRQTTGRRRVTVAGRAEREAKRIADLPEADDIRELADDMDDVLDGVEFEEDDES